MRKRKQIYLDGAANAPLGKEAVKAMKPYLRPGFCGNANSAHHFGAVADMALNRARESLALCLDVCPGDVLFTSGATESNNWVIKALALDELTRPEKERRMRIVVSAVEHASILTACESLKPLGFEIVRVPPMYDGSVLSASMKEAMRKGKTLLVCCMAVNNETGAKNHVNEIGAAARYAGAYMLCDVTQAMSTGGSALSLGGLYPYADFMSFSGHKLYGPTGIGCLVKANVPPPSLMSGGSQEFGLRSGTSNVAGAVGLAAAVRSLVGIDETERFTKLRGIILNGLDVSMYDDYVWGEGNRPKDAVRLNCIDGSPNIVSLDFSEVMSYPGVLADAFASEGIAVSAGAACSVDGNDQRPSHVLLAMGRSEERARHTVRVSFTKFTKPSDVKAFIRVAKKLIGMFPRQERNQK